VCDSVALNFSFFEWLVHCLYTCLNNHSHFRMSNKEIARQLNIALCTVEYHRANVREKLGLKKGDCANLSTVLLSLK